MPERNIDVRVRLKGADQFKTGMKGVTGSLTGMAGAVATGQAIYAAFERVISKVGKVLDKTADDAIAWESALAGVAKTTEFSKVGLENFGNQLTKLSETLPMTRSELAGLAEVGGQLGIAEEDLLSFTQTVAAMGVSTNMSAEDAATAMARIANIMGTSASDYERMGSVIVDLGNNYATTESEIAEMTLRAAGMGTIVGMTEANVMAFSTALSSIGIEAAAGGSSLQKIWQGIDMAVASDNADYFAEVANMTADAFTKLWNTNPAQATSELIKGLKRIEDEGGNATKAILGLFAGPNATKPEVRLTRSLLGLASSEGLLDGAIQRANEAWDDGTALAVEAGKRYETTASQIQIAQNKIDNAGADLIGRNAAALKMDYKQTLGDMASDAAKAARDIDLSKVVKANAKAFEEQKAAISDNADTARNLLSVIRGMGDYGALDANGMQEYGAALAALEQIVPDVNHLVNAQTGELSGNDTAVNELIDSMEDLAIKQAELDAERENADAYLITENELTAMLQKQAEAKARLNSLQERAVQLASAYETADMSTQEGRAAQQAWIDINNEITAVQAEVDGYTKTIDKSRAALAEYENVTSDFVASAEDLSGAVDRADRAISGMSETQQDAIEGLTLLDEYLTSAIEASNEVYDEIAESVGKNIGGFGEIDLSEIEVTGASELIENIQSQIDFADAYEEAFKAAQENGVDQTVLEQLADGSEESYATLKGLADASAEEVTTLNAKMAEVGASKQTLSETLAAAVSDLDSTVAYVATKGSELVAGAQKDAELYAAGAADVQSLANGIDSKISALAGKVNKVNGIMARLGSGGAGEYSHAGGLTYVPYDNYAARLHRGEMVLTALEARAYRATQFDGAKSSTSINNNNNVTNKNISSFAVNVNGMTVRNDMDIKKIARELNKLQRKKALGVT